MTLVVVRNMSGIVSTAMKMANSSKGTPTASKIGTSPRSDGKPQVTYDGHPLYAFQGDSKAGDTNGQGINAFGAHWYVLSSSGTAITTAPSGSGGNSYGY